MVEFALVLPVLLLVLLGILKFGLLFNNYITLMDAVRSGARTLALGRGLSSNVCTANPGGAYTQAISSAAPTITLTTASFTTVFGGAETCSNGTTWVQGDSATLKASYNCDLSIMGINFFPGCKLTASATEAIE